MKKTKILVLYLLLMASGAFTQTYVTQVKPAGNKDWGYANLKGEIIIPAQYDKCYEFSNDGVAVVYNNKMQKYQFITLNGQEIPTEIPKFKVREGYFGFDFKAIQDGLMPISVNNKWGYLSSGGSLAISIKYDAANDFEGGFAAVKIGSRYVIINKSGEETVIEESGLLDVNHFSEGLASFRAKNKEFGFMNTQGKTVIPAQFESVGYFHEGLAWAKVNKKVGYIDKSGAWVIKPQFEVGKDFAKEAGLARIKTADDWGYVTRTGETVKLGGTNIYEDFYDGLARGRKGEKFGFLNSKGEWVIEAQYDGSRDFKNGYAAVKKGNLWGIIDKTGQVIIEPKFDGIKDMELVK
jgi:hypothetical protein